MKKVSIPIVYENTLGYFDQNCSVFHFGRSYLMKPAWAVSLKSSSEHRPIWNLQFEHFAWIQILPCGAVLCNVPISYGSKTVESNTVLNYSIYY
jgi:hypothetical protein